MMMLEQTQSNTHSQRHTQTHTNMNMIVQIYLCSSFHHHFTSETMNYMNTRLVDTMWSYMLTYLHYLKWALGDSSHKIVSAIQ